MYNSVKLYMALAEGRMICKTLQPIGIRAETQGGSRGDARED
jgi:hypothetical protein